MASLRISGTRSGICALPLQITQACRRPHRGHVGCEEWTEPTLGSARLAAKLSLRLVVRALHISMALGESRRDIYARPYFRGRAVCPRADIEIGSLLASQTPDSPGMLLSTGHLAGVDGRRPDKLCQTESRRM